VDQLEWAGDQVPRVYLHAIPRSFMRQMRERAREMGLDDNGMTSRIEGIPDEEITTSVDVRDLVDRKRASFAAHVSQNAPNNPFQTMAAQILVAAFGTERFILARGALGDERPEKSLFVGL